MFLANVLPSHIWKKASNNYPQEITSGWGDGTITEEGPKMSTALCRQGASPWALLTRTYYM